MGFLASLGGGDEMGTIPSWSGLYTSKKSRLCPVPATPIHKATTTSNQEQKCVSRKSISPKHDRQRQRERGKARNGSEEKSKQSKTVQQKAWLALPN